MPCYVIIELIESDINFEIKKACSANSSRMTVQEERAPLLANSLLGWCPRDMHRDSPRFESTYERRSVRIKAFRLRFVVLSVKWYVGFTSTAGSHSAKRSTAIKILIGELKATKGEVYRHPNLRLAYIAQHAFQHLEKHLTQTPTQYILERFAGNEDKENIVTISNRRSYT